MDHPSTLCIEVLFGNGPDVIPYSFLFEMKQTLTKPERQKDGKYKEKVEIRLTSMFLLIPMFCYLLVFISVF